MGVLVLGAALLAAVPQDPSAPEAARTSFRVDLPPPARPEELLPDSPFGINTAVRPETPDLEARMRALQQAGVKWGRQDFPWKAIERSPGTYDFEPYDRLVELFRRHGIWAESILRQVPPYAFDIVGFHPYRAMNAPEEPMDWWMLDQYVKSWHRRDLTPEYPLVRKDFLEQTDPNTEKGLVCYDLYGTRRFVAYDPVCTRHNPFPLGQSPIYIVGPRGLRANVRPDPGW